MWDFCSQFYGFSSWQMWGGMILHWGLLIGSIYLLIRLFRPKSDQEDYAIYILEEQFAKGQITKEEFIERKSLLEK